VSVKAKFECKDVPKGDTPPTCTIYASTLRFCERVKVKQKQKSSIFFIDIFVDRIQ
jgi:hypothetical protein